MINKILQLAFIGITLLMANPVGAQDATPAPEKDILVVDVFARNRIVPAPYVEMLRAEVMQSIAARGRQRIVDAEASRELTAGLPQMIFADPAQAASQQAAFLEERMQQMTAMGARYVVTGAIADYKFEHADLPPASSKERPRPGFRATFNIILSAYDLKFCRPLPDELITLTATAPVAEDADRAALAAIRTKMGFYIDRNFKFETTILQLGAADKKGRIRELYIHSGTDMGVRSGDLFMVYEDVPIGGVMTRQKVGRLRVNDVQNVSVARCKIAKGDQEIIDAFQQGRGLICVSDGEALF